MNHIIEIQGKKFEIDVDKAVQNGYLKEVVPEIKIEPGDIFKSKSSEPHVIIKLYTMYGSPQKYILGGLGGNPCLSYSDEPMNLEELKEYILRYQAIKIGKIVMPKL